jgi:hypothetical protein
MHKYNTSLNHLFGCLSTGRKHWTPKQYVDQVAVWAFEDSSVGRASRIDMERVLRRL